MTANTYRRMAGKTALSCLLLCGTLLAQQPQLNFLNGNRPLLDAHNCYPYNGKWADRIDRALQTGFPVGIEQDLAWYVDPQTKKGRVVVTHSAQTNGSEPTLRAYFFERVRPIMEKALAENREDRWPLIVVHFDFKDNRPELLQAVWELLGSYQSWITTAKKGTDPNLLAPFQRKPLLVLTEDSDAQEKVFFDDIPSGSNLRLFGSAHTNIPREKSQGELIHLAATLLPEQLLTKPATNYRRWWNNSWYEVEEGGQPHAGDWTKADADRLLALVNRAHDLGYWIRFYTLDGFTSENNRGWSKGYNFGSLEAASVRWKAAIAAGVNLIATDQYEELAPALRTINPGEGKALKAK